MTDLDIFKVLTEAGFPVAVAFYLFYQMRLDRADALRRETAYAETLRADKSEQQALMREIIESNVRMERIVHELKNVLQQIVFDNRRSDLKPRDHRQGDE